MDDNSKNMVLQTEFDIFSWLDLFLQRLTDLFGSRLRFFGIQGSYGRGEPTMDSDIDVVVIVDGMDHHDLLAYRNMIDKLDYGDKVCGFVCGTAELCAWEKSDLLQLVLDTRAVMGSLDSFGLSFTREDVRRAVHAGACTVYHACSHNLLHARGREALVGLYKAARFTVRMKYYYDTGDYVASFRELADVVSGEDREVLVMASSLAVGLQDYDLDAYSLILVDWAAGVLREVGWERSSGTSFPVP